MYYCDRASVFDRPVYATVVQDMLIKQALQTHLKAERNIVSRVHRRYRYKSF